MGILNDELNRIHHGMAKIAAKYFGEGETMADFIDRQATINAVGLTTDAIKIDPIYVDTQGNELVAVVRCKDCQYFKKAYGWNGCEYTECDHFNCDVPEDGFCAWGERKE